MAAGGIVLRCIGFDLGLSNTAFAIVTSNGAGRPIYQHSGTLTTSAGDSLAERAHSLCADIGEVLWLEREPEVEIAAEEPPMGSTHSPWVMKASGQVQIVRGILTAAALYGRRPCAWYAPRVWQAALGIPPPPRTLAKGDRRKWIKARVHEHVSAMLEGADGLANEHERDAAAVAVAHLLKRRGPE